MDHEHSVGRSILRTPLETDRGYRIRASRFEALGLAVERLQIRVHALRESDDIDGLLGLNFLRYLQVTLDFDDGYIDAAPSRLAAASLA